jgi:hypothetical protein
MKNGPTEKAGMTKGYSKEYMTEFQNSNCTLTIGLEKFVYCQFLSQAMTKGSYDETSGQSNEMRSWVFSKFPKCFEKNLLENWKIEKLGNGTPQSIIEV